MKFHRFQSYPSTYVALVVWALAGFMGEPTLAAGVVHLILVPFLLAIVLYLAHWEGRHTTSV